MPFADDEPRASTFALLYARFRGSMLFVWFLTLFCATWIGWNKTPGLPHFDGPGFPLLTLILSIEASLSVALLIMDTARQEAHDRRQTKYMLHLMEAMVEMLEQQKGGADADLADAVAAAGGVPGDRPSGGA